MVGEVAWVRSPTFDPDAARRQREPYEMAVFEGPRLVAVFYAYSEPDGASRVTRFDGGRAETTTIPVSTAQPEDRPTYG